MNGQDDTSTFLDPPFVRLDNDERRWLRRKVDIALAGTAADYFKFIGLVLLACAIALTAALAVGLHPFGLLR